MYLFHFVWKHFLWYWCTKSSTQLKGDRMDKPIDILHLACPELWFRPSLVLPFSVLSELFATHGLITTPRLGKRDGTHSKGYVPGTAAMVRLFDERWQEHLREDVCIVRVVSKPLRDFQVSELKDTVYNSVGAMQQDLSFFDDNKPVGPDDIVSLVEFSRPKRSGGIKSWISKHL